MILLGIISNFKQELLRRQRLRDAIDELNAECETEIDRAYNEYSDACRKITQDMMQSFFDRASTSNDVKAKADRDAEIARLRYEQRINDTHETYERKLNLLLYNS